MDNDRSKLTQVGLLRYIRIYLVPSHPVNKEDFAVKRAAFEPYEGNEPFIFISYAYKNSAEVFPILEKLDAAGYRVWYDDRTAPDSEWPEYIAEHLNASSVVVAFVSPASVESPNCHREVTCALTEQKPFLSVLLEKTKMSRIMEMWLETQPCIRRYNYVTEGEFLVELLNREVLKPCLKPGEKLELYKDILLTFQSISKKNGHAGYEIRYCAATREAKEHSYSIHIIEGDKYPWSKGETQSKDKVDTLSIPDTVTNEQELREYIRRNRPGWRIDSFPKTVTNLQELREYYRRKNQNN